MLIKECLDKSDGGVSITTRVTSTTPVKPLLRKVLIAPLT